MEVTGKLDFWLQCPDRAVQILHLLRMRVTGCISQADMADARIEIGLHDVKHFLLYNRTLKPAAERRLYGNLNQSARCHRLFCHRDDSLESLACRHACILPAVCLTGGDAHTDHLHPAGEAALQSFFIQDQARENDPVWFVIAEVSK